MGLCQDPRLIRQCAVGAPLTLRTLFIANNLIPTLQAEVRSFRKARTLLAKIRSTAPDIIVFCRYSGPCAAIILDCARALGAAVIFHIDDDLLNVPLSLGAAKHAYHNQHQRLSTVNYLLETSDFVYASNERLAQHLVTLADIKLIKTGAVYCASEIHREPSAQTRWHIGYMGFDHADDFAVVAPAIEALMMRYEQLRFTMFGPIPVPEPIARFGERVAVIDPIKDYAAFGARLAAEAWDIGLCPLLPTPFNLLKADTKWVEYTASGMATVASGGAVYDHCCANDCGILVGNSPDQWEAALVRLLENSDLRLRLARNAQTKVAGNYSMAALSQQVLDIFAQAREISISNIRVRPNPLQRLRTSIRAHSILLRSPWSS